MENIKKFTDLTYTVYKYILNAVFCFYVPIQKNVFFPLLSMYFDILLTMSVFFKAVSSVFVNFKTNIIWTIFFGFDEKSRNFIWIKFENLIKRFKFLTLIVLYLWIIYACKLLLFYTFTWNHPFYTLAKYVNRREKLKKKEKKLHM